MIQIEAKRRKARVNASLSVLSGGCRTPLSLTMGTIIDHYKSLGKKMDLDELKTGISKQRLDTYRKMTKTTKWSDAVDVYFWHAEVCSSLLQPLGFFEVNLRNFLNLAISSRYREVRGRHMDWPEEWFFMHQNWLWLADIHMKKLSSVIYDVKNLPGQKAGFHPKEFHIVPRMKFQFWEDLLDETYVDRIWIHSYSIAFPNAELSADSAQDQELRRMFFKLKSACQLIRETRNRVAHHEPIFKFDIESVLEKIEMMLALMSKEAWSRVCVMNKIVLEKWKSPPACFKGI